MQYATTWGNPLSLFDACPQTVWYVASIRGKVSRLWCNALYGAQHLASCYPIKI